MASDSEQLRLSRETAKAFEETLRLTHEQFRVGVGSELEVRQAETSYQGAVNDIAALETSVARDQHALTLLEIGRASCRERVCPYVWISVCAVSIKTKSRLHKNK